MIDFTPILQALSSLAIAIITCVIVPWVRARTTQTQQSTILYWVRIAVEAAEMMMQGNGLGTPKKAFVVDFLASKGLRVEPAALEALIESAVLQLKRGD